MIEYELKRGGRGRRNTILKIVDGKLIVSAPRLIPKFMIDQFVREKEDWIREHLKKSKPHKKISFTPEMRILYLGIEYPVQMSVSKRKTVRIMFMKDHFWVSVPDGKTQEETDVLGRKELTKWYRERARVIFWKQTRHYAGLLGLKFLDIRIKDTKTRWGSCSFRGNLNYNWRLMMAPMEVVNSLVVHEVCHLAHQNHGKNFWALVYKTMPEYDQAHGWLLKNKEKLRF